MATTGSWQLCTPSPWTDASPHNAPPKAISIPSRNPAASFPQLVAQPPKLRTPDLACCSSGSGSSCEISAFDTDDDDEIIATDPMQPSCSHAPPNHRSLSPSSSSLSCASQHDTLYSLSELSPAASPSTSSPSLDDDDSASYHSSHDLATFLHQMSLPSSRIAFFCKDVSFSPQLCWELADFVSYSPSLRILTLSNCQLTDALLEILLPFLASSVSLVTIDLPNNLLTDRGAALLTDLVKGSPSSNISELQLGGNSIGDEGAAALASALASSRKLATLNLASNNITDAGCRALGRAVAAAGKLCTKTVQVSPGNNISAAAGAELARTTSGGGKRVLRLLSSLRG